MWVALFTLTTINRNSHWHRATRNIQSSNFALEMSWGCIFCSSLFLALQLLASIDTWSLSLHTHKHTHTHTHWCKWKGWDIKNISLLFKVPHTHSVTKSHKCISINTPARSLKVLQLPRPPIFSSPLMMEPTHTVAARHE